MDAYDRERRDPKDPKTIGQRNRIIQQWWEAVSDERKAEAGRVVEKWNKLDTGEKISQTWPGVHVVMFIAHEGGEGQIKMAVFETAPGDGKKAFTESSEASKDWVLNGENILMDYLLTAPVEEDSAEKQEVEISLDEDGNPQMPTWAGQKLKVQQNLARAVFHTAYGGSQLVWAQPGIEVWGIAKFTQKPKAKVPWSFLIKSPMEYLDQISYLKSLSIMPRYQVLIDPVDALPEQEHGKGPEVEWQFLFRGLEVVLGLGLLLRECNHAQEVEEDDPMRGDDVMDAVGVVVSRLEQCPAGTKGPQGGDGGAGLDDSDRGDEEKEKEKEEEEEAPPRKRKRAGSGL
ncbi:hypothetical protein EV401DRAFT_1892489 [Pisolithus croceorrhizus]|nr:hypothetical protein EV401DRAFT_1892489 [Pisolithus croceorrhizus]